MFAQYLVLLRATILLNSKKNIIRAVNSPQVNKERACHVNFVSEELLNRFPKVHLKTRLQAHPCS